MTEPIEIDMNLVEQHVNAMCKAIEGLPKCKTSELIIALALVGSRSLPARPGDRVQWVDQKIDGHAGYKFQLERKPALEEK